MSLSLVEGMLYALMVGFGEAYFLADAVRLGATPIEAALVASLPLFIGAAGPAIALRLLSRLRTRRRLVAGAIFGQASVMLVLGLATGSMQLTPAWIIGAASLYQIFGQAAGTGWGSWFGDLVPKAVRGSYFARRNRGVHVATCASLLLAGGLLQWLEPESAAEAAGLGGQGFRVVFLLSAAARFASGVLIVCTAEPRFHGLSSGVRVVRYLRTARGSSAWRLVMMGASFHLVVYLGSPYFAPYMLESLRFSYLEYTAATVCIVLFKVTALPLWGRLIDQHGPRQIFGLAMLGIGITPLPFLLADGLPLVLVAQSLSGISWGAHELSQFALILDSSYKRTRPQLFAAQSLLHGTAQLSGCLLAAPILAFGGGDLRVLFVVSMIGRLAVGLAMPHMLPAPRGSAAPSRRELLLRVLGIRAHGGLVHRTLPDAEDEPPESEAPANEEPTGELADAAPTRHETPEPAQPSSA